MKENIIKIKSFSFAIRIIKLYQFLQTEKKEFVLSKQMLRSGTSVGALIREAEYAETKKDFIHKMAIAQKETNETIYRIELLKESEYITDTQFTSIYEDSIEIIKVITSIIKTSKNNVN